MRSPFPVPRAMCELVRFDEALDQALTESIAHFSSRLTRYRDLFVGVVAHDLRTPLQAVAMFAEAIRNPGSCGRRARSMRLGSNDLDRRDLGWCSRNALAVTSIAPRVS